jgi:acetoin utilization deacetylase AcuC-like enzyme
MSHLRTGLLLDDIFRSHDTGEGHPECAARYRAVSESLTKQGITDEAVPIEQRLAEPDEIMLCHLKRYFEIAKADVESGAHELSTGDTQVCPKSFDVAMRAVGGVLNAVDEVMTGKLRNAFCAVRPPGHHARPGQGMGFCLFNNIAIGARHAQKKHGAGKVMIVDWDVHHGNGTQDIFNEDGSVLFFSTHQSPWYPFTGHREEIGEGKGRNCIINSPLPSGSGMKEISAAFLDRLIPAAQDFKPDLVMISAGFDSRKGDPLGHFQLTDPDFASLTKMLMQFADENCNGRIVSVMEGGYNVAGLAAGVSAHVRALLGD